MMNNSFEIFVCRGGHKSKREALIKRAALAYGADKEALSKTSILRTDAGKPYFDGLDIYFNISHSRELWACLIGPTCCGLDVQYVKPCNFEKIAGRFFSRRERKYIEERGIEGFFEIWVRREAYGKYTGEGFFGRMPEFVGEDGIPVAFAGEAAIEEIAMSEDIKCAVCVSAEAAPRGVKAAVRIREDF